MQALVRAHLSKRIVAKMTRKRREERTEDARAWIETWSEDAQAWFYYNPQTGQLGRGRYQDAGARCNSRVST